MNKLQTKAIVSFLGYLLDLLELLHDVVNG